MPKPHGVGRTGRHQSVWAPVLVAITCIYAGKGIDPSYPAVMVRKHGSLTQDSEINEASWVAARGAAVGAAKWGIFSAIAACAGYAYSPVYRGLTIQFKVFLQMSGMTAGAIIDADRRLIAHEAVMRNRKKVARDQEVWRRYQEDYQQLLDEAAAAENNASDKD